MGIEMTMSGRSPFGHNGNLHHGGPQFAADACCHFLVLTAVEGAGGIDHPSSRPQGGPDVADNLPLAFGTSLHRLRTQLAAGGFIFAEHAFARAGDIGSDDVEEALERSEFLGIGRSDDGGRMPPFRKVFRQNLRPLPDGLVGHQQRIVGDERAP